MKKKIKKAIKRKKLYDLCTLNCFDSLHEKQWRAQQSLFKMSKFHLSSASFILNGKEFSFFFPKEMKPEILGQLSG